MSTNMVERPPPSASPIYVALYDTALNFIKAQSPNAEFPDRMDFETIRTYCTPSFRHSWGHNYAVSTSPPLRGTMCFDEFVGHMKSMLPKLMSWKADVVDITVDPVKMKVIMRISFWMWAKGAEAEDLVENDMLWALEMEEIGDGRMGIKKSTEFMDGAAADRLRETMMATMWK